MELTEKQKKFVDEYLVDLNATQAAIRSGYSVDSAGVIGCENLTKPYIQEAIALKRKQLFDKNAITPERVFEELSKLGFSNMRDYMRITKDGDPCIDLSEITRDQAAALTEVMVEDYTEGRGDDARDVKRVKIKLADKRSALVDLGKHLGMFKERIEHTGKDGAPLVPEVNADDIARRIAFTLSRATTEKE